MIKKYTPTFDTTIEAVQFKGYNILDVMELCGTRCFIDGSLPRPQQILIVTVDGKKTAKVGDYIIKALDRLTILEKEDFEANFNEKGDAE